MSERIFNNTKVSVEITKTQQLSNISSNENVSTTFGKIEKMFDHILNDIDPTLSDKADTDTLSEVATSGSYTDLINKPIIDTQVDESSTNAVQNSAIYAYVNSSIATATADFKGTYDSLTELQSVTDADNNDYGFVVSTDEEGNTVYSRYKYTGSEWVFEYKLNNSSFTAAEWEAIQSGLTKGDKTNFVNHMNSTSNPHAVTKSQVGLGNVDNTSDANKPISTATQTALDGKVDKVAGKQLSTNDFSDADKSKLDNLENYDDAKMKADIAKVASHAAVNKTTLGYQSKSLIDLGNLASTTINGITITNLGDGTYKVNGTATVQVTKSFSIGITKFINEDIVLSGCPSGGNYSTGYALYVADGTDTTTIARDIGNGAAFKPTAKYNIAIIVRKGATVNNLIFKPMLRYAEITDDTFEQYKPSVDERISELPQLTSIINGLSTIFNGMYYSVFVDFENGANSRALVGDFKRIKAVTNRRRCNVSADGTINAYIGDESYTEDGSNGQVMVYQPKFYYRVEPTKLVKNTAPNSQGYQIRQCIYSISDYPLDGFKLHPAFINDDGKECDYVLIGAFEGCLFDTSENTIITNDAQVADFNTDKLYSVAGVKPISGRTQNLTRVNAEKLAANNGSGWHICDMRMDSVNQMLMIIEFMPNLQKALGPGVSGMADIDIYNCSSLTGSTSNGLVESAIPYPNTGIAISTTNEINGVETVYTATEAPTKVSVEYRGMENPYGNIWELANGCNLYGNGSMLGGVPYICKDSNYAEEKRTDNYESAGFTVPNTTGYIKYFGYGNPDYDWFFMGTEIGGNENGVIGDYHYINTNLNGYRITVLGGRWANGSRCGPFSWILHTWVGDRVRSIGARVCYRP